ncbi:MAG: T9SS C-terminal target domain-containing protein [Chitinophagaceae bacterium]|nr:T9SS C-terminal target domain-containing protein [Chitinophagaceae bacterium]
MRTSLLLILLLPFYAVSQNVGIGTTTPDITAKLDVSSTTQGFLPPRMTSVQRDAIVAPANGLVIYNITTNCLEIYRAVSWYSVCNGGVYITGKTNKLIGGVNTENPYSMEQTADGGFIVAGISNSSVNGDVTGTNHGGYDIWVVKLDGGGNILWNRLYGGSADDIAESIIQTADGGYVVAGYSASSATGDVSGVNNGLNDYWIIKLDAAGNILWNKLYGGSLNDYAYSIASTTDGGYAVTGYAVSSATGDVVAANHGGSDVWVLKLDASGNIVWNKLLGGGNDDDSYSIRQTSDGGYIISGDSNSSANGDVTDINHGSYDFWVIKLDPSGNISWNKLFGGSGSEGSFSSFQTTDGGYILAGYSGSSASGDVTAVTHGLNDLWIVKLNSSGAITWNKLVGGSNEDFGRSVRQTTDGGFIIAGNSLSGSSGDITDPGHGGSDYIVTRLTSAGILSWVKLYGGIGTEAAYSVIQLADGGYMLAGYSSSSANGDVIPVNHSALNDFWILKLAGSGIIF